MLPTALFVVAVAAARSPPPHQALGAGAGTQAPYSPPGELCRLLPSLLSPPGLPRAPPQRELQHRKQWSSSDKEKVLHFGRDQVRWGEVQGRSPPRHFSNPNLPSIAHPLESGVWEGGGFNAALHPTSQVPILPITSVSGLCEEGRGLPSVTMSCPPLATGLRGTSRPLLNCHTPCSLLTSLSLQTPEAGGEPPPLPLPRTARRPNSAVLVSLLKSLDLLLVFTEISGS